MRIVVLERLLLWLRGLLHFPHGRQSDVLRFPVFRHFDYHAGAGLDVYEREPVIDPGLLALDNVVLLPHLGSATTRARSEMARVAATNLIAALDGQAPPNLVNPGVLASRG